MDSVTDHLVPQISKKMTTRNMFKTLKNLFEHRNNATGARNMIIMLVAVEVQSKGSMKLQLLM